METVRREDKLCPSQVGLTQALPQEQLSKARSLGFSRGLEYFDSNVNSPG